MIDWGTGRYEDTAIQLEPVAEVVAGALAPAAGERVLDVGCGTGNAALAVARRGARVTGIDPAPRLVEVARERAAPEGLEIAFGVGDATALEHADASFDAVVSVFAVIFAPDPRAAAAELLRVVRPGGRILITAWTPEGTIFEMGRAARRAMDAVEPRPGGPPVDWSDPARLRDLFGPDAGIAAERHAIAFMEASPRALLDRFVADHPVYLAIRAALEPPAWEALQTELLALLRAGNEDPAAFRATSRYALVTVTPGPAAS